MDELFNAGPRLRDEPAGDVRAQAVASLRGYAYQLFASAFAWVNLQSDEVLYLEVAQDYAVVGNDVLNAVEVKDRPASVLTLNSDGVKAALESFVKLVSLNPQRRVQLHFISTGEIGREKAQAHRIGDKPALEYWRRAAAGADVGALRCALLALDLAPSVRAFIDARDDDRLREEFLGRIHWDCQAAALDELSEAVEASLERFVIEQLDARSYEKGQLLSAVVHKVLVTCVQPKDRRLDATALKALLIDATKISVPRWQLEAMMNAAVGNKPQAITVEQAPSALEMNDSIPFPVLLAPRSALVNAIVHGTGPVGVGFLSGSSGCGKTLVARLTGRRCGGRWGIVDCRDLLVDETVARLNRAVGAVGAAGLRGVILEDVNTLDEPRVQRALSVFVSAARRADVRCLVTAYLAPSARVLSELGVDATVHFGVGHFSEAEIEELLFAANQDPSSWARAVFLGSAFGHPQLVQALLMGLKGRNWPAAERDSLLSLQTSEEVEASKSAARRQLIAAVPEPARVLLYRASLILGRFGRTLAMALGGIAPAVTNPGEQLDLLVGPWIEPLGAAQLRVSPLVKEVGREVISPDEQAPIHRVIAEKLVHGRKIDVTDANAAFLHALMGRAEQVLLGLAHSILVASHEQRRQLAQWMIGLRLHRLDRPIDAPTLALPVMLRLAQFLLISPKKDGKAIRACWSALVAELDAALAAEQRDGFEFMMLAKVLIDDGAAGQLPNWIHLILRFESLARKSQHQWVLQKQRTGNGRVSTAIGVIFLVQLWHTDSVAGLLAAFEQLNQLSSVDRKLLFSDLETNFGDFRYIVDHAWSSEHKRHSLDGKRCAEAYSSMATMAMDWGYQVLALHCHVARAIMLDEYVKDSGAAEAALQEAGVLFGESPALSRAKARIFYRRKDYASALGLMRGAKGEASANADPIERAYLFREAGISAGELGQWDEARGWFSASREAASRAHVPAMKVMTVGLHADEALAAARAGDLGFAVATMHTVIGELDAFEAGSSLVAGYCHRVTRHGILWLFQLCTGQTMEVDNEPARMVPGMCSNPEPQDMSAMPLAAADYALYLLAQAAIEASLPPPIEDQIIESLAGRSIAGMELGLRHSRLTRAIEMRDAAETERLLPPWASARVFLESHPEVMRRLDMIAPVYAELPTATALDNSSETTAVALNDAVLAFAVCCAMSADLDGLVQLRARIYELSTNTEVRHKLDVMAGSATDRGSESQRLALAARNSVLTPDELFVVTLIMMHVAARSTFKQMLGRRMAVWSRNKWGHAISQQTFLMSNPRVNTAAIQRTLNESVDNLGFVARLLLAAEPATSTQLDKGYRDFLESLSVARS